MLTGRDYGGVQSEADATSSTDQLYNLIRGATAYSESLLKVFRFKPNGVKRRANLRGVIERTWKWVVEDVVWDKGSKT